MSRELAIRNLNGQSKIHAFDGIYYMLIPSLESEYSQQKHVDAMTFEHMIYEKIPVLVPWLPGAGWSVLLNPPEPQTAALVRVFFCLRIRKNHWQTFST
ncbi:hypothetical protein ACFX2H_013625 [Malus domestica]